MTAYNSARNLSVIRAVVLVGVMVWALLLPSCVLAASSQDEGSSPAAASAQPSLESISVSPAGEGQILVQLRLSAPLAQKPSSFTVQKPPRLALDLPGVRLDVKKHFRKFGAGVLRAYAAVSAGGRTRVVFNLDHMVPYHISHNGSNVLLRLGAASNSAPAPGTAVQTTSKKSHVHHIDHIDFRRGENGAGRVIVSLSDPDVQVDVKREGNKIVVHFKDTQAADKLLKRLDVLDFATPVKYIDTRRDGRGADVIITPVTQGNFQELSFQTDDEFSLVLEPLTPQEQKERARKHPRYTGKKISLDFQKVGIRALLQIIADVAKVNMVVSDSVTGQIAIRLHDVPWDQALAIILQSKGLGQRRQGNVIFVAPLKEMAARRKMKLESEQQVTKLAPLHSELMQVNYAKAAEIAKLLKSGDRSILGKRGRVTVDARTNTLLVLDTTEKLTKIRGLIRQLDVPVRQVEIESRIVIANNKFDRQVGTQLGLTGLTSVGHKGFLTTSGTTQGTNSILNQVTQNNAIVPPGVGVSQSSGGSGGSGSSGSGGGSNQVRYDNVNNPRFNLNLPVQTAGAPGSLALAFLGSKILVDLELQALQAEGSGEVISNPRVITANGKEAHIEQGKEIPYQESTSSGATSVQFKKAVLGLTVTPQITPDGRIIMDLAVRSDDVGENVPTGNGGFAPAIDTRRVTTQVLVNDGQTVVLGGIYQNTKQRSVSKVPLLGDIPILGALFRFTEHQNNRTELLVFITPKIIKQQLTLSGND